MAHAPSCPSSASREARRKPGPDGRPRGRDQRPRRSTCRSPTTESSAARPTRTKATAEFAVNTARLAGFIPSKRQPLPETHKLWEGYLILSLFTESYRAMRDYANIESTVLH